MSDNEVKKSRINLKLIPLVIFFMVLMMTVRLKSIFLSFDVEQDNNIFAETKANAADANSGKAKEDNLMAPGQDFAPGYLMTEDADSDIAGNEEYSPSEIDVLQSLAKRREEIDAREKQVEQQMALLKAAEGQIERKISSLKSYEKSIKELLGEYDKKEQERLQGLVDLYTKMKPKDAAVIFDDLEMNILIVLFEKMRTQNAAAILSAMSPEKARALTIELADRNKLNSLNLDSGKSILR
ncbi:MAG: MotE family protein [Alphaproteobacteria bacterium]